jgi:aspartate/methionine/tyrosine aminotransferase
MTLRGILSEREEELPEEDLGKLMKILVEKKDIISLGPGQPDFGPPKHVISAAKKALDKGCSAYSPIEGRKELLEELTKKLKRENGIDTSPEQICVTSGSNEAILLALMCVVDPGEEVLVPDPGFLDYIPSVEILNGYPVSIPLYYENNFQLEPESIRNLIKDKKKLKAIIINTPGNPTGTVFSKKLLERIAEIAVENNLLIISDEAYEKFVYNTKHVSIGSLNGMHDYVLTLQTFSKTYGMPGFRVGYAVGSKKIINAIRYIHLFDSLCAPTISQIAAVAALKGPQNHIKKIVKEYDKRRKFLAKRINEIKGLECKEPQGAFYILAKYDFDMKARNFVRWLIDNAKVSVVPGTDFGRYGEGFIRFSYATDFNLIKKAMDRIEKALKKLK